MVTQIDEKAQTVSLERMRAGKVDIYAIDQFKAISVNDRSGTFADIKVGMEVRSVIERDMHTLDIISVSAADSAPTGAAAPKRNS